MGAHDDNQTRLFEQLLKPHLERLYRFACRLTHSKPEAEDLFQDVLTKVYGRLDELAEVRDPAPWLNRVLYNHFVDNQRRYARQRLVSVDASQLPGESVEALPGHLDTAAECSRRDDIRQLEAALARLSDEQRTIVLLHDIEGYKLEEIHEITGAPVGTIKSRLHRARGRLRDFLRDEGTFSAAQTCSEVTDDDHELRIHQRKNR